MSRIGTKKPPIKNAYYAPQEHVPVMNCKGKSGYAKSEFSNSPSWAKDDYKGYHIEKE